MLYIHKNSIEIDRISYLHVEQIGLNEQNTVKHTHAEH